MIGMRTAIPAIFALPMSTDEVIDQTIATANSLGFRNSLTPTSFDLDTVGDFRCFDVLSPALLLDLCPRTVKSISVLPLPVVL